MVVNAVEQGVVSEEYLHDLNSELVRFEASEGFSIAGDGSKLESGIGRLGGGLLGNHGNLVANLLIRMTRLKDKKLGGLALSILEEKYGGIGQNITPENARAGVWMEALSRVIEGSVESSDDARELMVDRLGAFVDNLEKVEDVGAVSPYVLLYGSEQQQIGVGEMITQSLFETDMAALDIDHIYNNFAYRMLNSPENKVRDRVVAHVISDLRKYGFASSNVADRWEQAFAEHDVGKIVLLNYVTIRNLESESPGLVSYLQQRQNVVNFGRYPMELLLDQKVRERDDRQTAVHVSADWDARDSGFYKNELPVLLTFHKEIKNRYKLLVIEVGNKQDFEDYVDNPDRHGTEDFAIIHAHGSKYSMMLNNSDKSIDALDFLQSGNKLGFARLRKEGLLLLQSCSTGHTDSDDRYLANKMSSVLQRMVIAPAEDAWVKEMSPVFDEEGRLIDIDIEFMINSKLSAETRRFVAGALVEK